MFGSEANTGYCCPEGATSAKCTSSATLWCSSSYVSNPGLYHQYCPANTAKFCSDKQSSSKLVASLDKSSFDVFASTYYEKQLLLDADNNRFDSCSYVISAPNNMYSESSEIKFKLKSLKNAVAMISTGNEMYKPDLTELKDNDFPVDKIYSIPYKGEDHDLLVTIIPNAAADTGFEFEYWVDGVETKTFWTSFMIQFLDNGILVIAIALFILFSIICCFTCYLKHFSEENNAETDSKQNQIEPHNFDSDSEIETNASNKNIRMRNLKSPPMTNVRASHDSEAFPMIQGSGRGGHSKNKFSDASFNQSGKDLTMHQVINEFRQKLMDAVRLSPEEFFRVCDYQGTKKVSTEEFKQKVKALELNITGTTLHKLV